MKSFARPTTQHAKRPRPETDTAEHTSGTGSKRARLVRNLPQGCEKEDGKVAAMAGQNKHTLARGGIWNTKGDNGGKGANGAHEGSAGQTKASSRTDPRKMVEKDNFAYVLTVNAAFDHVWDTVVGSME
jgi:hypothetical protein